MNNFFVIGVNHKLVSSQERGKFIEWMKNIASDIDTPLVLLSTCLRCELYIRGNRSNILKRFSLFSDKLYLKTGKRAIEHLFNVSCGLDSEILGENEILGQVKNAYFLSFENGNTDKFLNLLFNIAIATGKKFRAVSKINENALSVPKILFKILENKAEKNSKIFIIGHGGLAVSLLKYFTEHSFSDITITNRTHSKLYETLEEYGNVKIIPFRQRYLELKNMDIIITATSAPHYIFKKREVLANLKKKSYVFVDLAVPYDIERGIDKDKRIDFISLEMLYNSSKKNSEKRKKIADDFGYVIDDGIKKFLGKVFYEENKDWDKRKQTCVDSNRNGY